MMKTKMMGNKIAAARMKLNITQAQLAHRMFISAQAVGKWERGESVPDIITMNRLAEILGVDLNYFSENFRSTVNDTPPAELLVQPPAEFSTDKQNLSAGKAVNKPNWNMSGGNWVDADFSGLKNLHDKFSNSNMQCCKFIGSGLSGLLLKNNHVANCDFTASDFSNSRFQSSYLSGNQFNDCLLKDVEFIASYFSGCDFSGADFTGAVIKSGGIEKSKMEGSVWNRLSLIDSHLGDIVLEGTVEDCSFENCAFTKVTFKNAILLNTFFKCKSLKRIRFIDCQADRMTCEFLKNGKADLSGITQLTI
jgi:uncharacterized protein YjbI with pentapeptide repeats